MNLFSVKTLLYVPGNKLKMLKKAKELSCDTVIFDLEDAVGPSQKQATREILSGFLSQPFPKPYFIRTNAVGTLHFQSDIEAVSALKPYAIVLPKSNAASVLEASQALDDLAAGTVAIIPLIESALAVESVADIVTASPRIAGAQLGAEDLTADLGIGRTRSGEELHYARHRVAYGCRAAGLPAFDTPFPHFKDREALNNDCQNARMAGFTGKPCIHPDQIEVVNKAFLPSEREIQEAEAILNASQGHQGSAFAFEGQMVDEPVLERARLILSRQ